MTARFSAEAEKRFSDLLVRYPRKEAALLPVLWLAQREFGHLSAEVRRYVAERMELPLTNVESVASFYTMYESRPVGKHTVQVCRNVSCRLKGSGELSAWMARELGVSPGETTADGSITYSEVECLGACGGAPVVRVDEAYQENAAVKDLERVIGKLRGSGGEDR